MGRPKKIIETKVEETIEKSTEKTIEKTVEIPTIEPYYVRVLDGDTIKIIDANKEKNWMLKYKHVSGSNFHF